MTSRKKPVDVAASVHQRLLNLSHQGEEDFQTLLIRYGLERLMYRVTRLDTDGQFILKGALAFCIWEGKLHRATHDLDFLGSGRSDAAYFIEFFRDLCALEVEEDGIRLVEKSLEVRQVREDEEYQGVRIQLLAQLGNARIPLTIDFGFGDVVTPAPTEVDFPALLGFPKPHVRAYPRETIIAEKFWIMAKLGMGNTRLKDYYDLWVLSKNFSFEGQLLCQALQATFARRNTAFPTETPVGLSPAFADNPLKQSQWASFLKKGRLVKESLSLAEVIPLLHDFLMPLALALAAGQPFAQAWPAAGPWQSADVSAWIMQHCSCLLDHRVSFNTLSGSLRNVRRAASARRSISANTRVVNRFCMREEQWHGNLRLSDPLDQSRRQKCWRPCPARAAVPRGL